MGAVATAMNKISPKTKRKNARDIFNLLNTKDSDLRDINGEDTIFTELISAPGTQQDKLVYGMGTGTARIV